MKKKILAISLVLAIALSALGVGYALWSDTLTISGTVNTGSVGVEWSPAQCSDNETKDVSSVTADIVGKELIITVNNAYPCVTYTVLADIHCTGSVPVHLQGIVLEGVPGCAEVTVTDVVGVQLHYCDSIDVLITIHLDNTAPQGSVLSFSASVDAYQYNESPV